eukprot:TRINITY_DN7219_c0_g1_i11.p1 TRINITY_DN7219_c0_g1~~TRINITY_DN7219_c0_g1_i11.p1  ORF type:complete len:104 (-),score=10.08 TRINITY_DN7219_c0_g1_i11:96-407(-)
MFWVWTQGNEQVKKFQQYKIKLKLKEWKMLKFVYFCGYIQDIAQLQNFNSTVQNQNQKVGKSKRFFTCITQGIEQLKKGFIQLNLFNNSYKLGCISLFIFVRF